MTQADIDDFSGSTLMRTIAAVEDDADTTNIDESVAAIVDTVTAYTNQEDPTPTAFGEVYTFTDGGDDNDLENDPHDALDLRDIDGEGTDAAVAMIRFDVGTLAPGTSMVTLSVADDEGTLAGMFDGVPGEYRCTNGNGCSIEVDEDGAVIAIPDTFVFVPTAGEMVPVADTDYLTFGYWVQESTDEDDAPTYLVTTFYDGEMPYTASPPAGQATYTGSATGVYVEKTDVHADGKGTVPTSSGQFTADVKLTATFGTPTSVGSDDHDSIKGTVSSFTKGDGSMLAGWELALTAGLNGLALTNAETSGGKDMPAGSWEASFFGPATGPDGDDADMDPDPVRPSSVAGEFNGHFDGSDGANPGHVLGAFGACEGGCGPQ
jgi:hypothetical protein